MIDLQKAFDTVDHNIFFQKSNAFVVESVEFFNNYLNKIWVKFYMSITLLAFRRYSGVPQGCILGPQHFLCYVNDTIQLINSFGVTSGFVYPKEVIFHIRIVEEAFNP